MHLYAYPFGVVETGAAQLFVLEVEAQRADQVQSGSGVGAKAYDIPCIGWNLRLIKYQVEH